MVKIRLNDPVVVSQAPPDVRSWGPWQFPLLQRMNDGRLLLEFHKEADSATAYGTPVGQAVSADDGVTWRELPTAELAAGLPLPNGDRLQAIQKPSFPAKGLPLPEPLAHVPSSYPLTYTFYRREELPAELRSGWWFKRKPAGSNTWVEEQARVDLPDDYAVVTEGVLVQPFFEHDRIHLAPDGSLLATLYARPHIEQGRTIVRRYLTTLVESRDNGRSWQLKGTIPYYPNPRVDPLWDARDGFSEPQITFLPDGSLFVLLRTNDGNGNGPLYAAHSLDGGSTWDQPRVFDSFGVWPQLLTLKNGVTLASYGRMGLCIRATDDSSARKWSRRVAVIPVRKTGGGTCGYSELVELSDGSALIAYSNFNVPDAKGLPCKSILVRRVEICG